MIYDALPSAAGRATATPPSVSAHAKIPYQCGLLQAPGEKAFERLTRMAAQLFDVPLVLIALADGGHRWFQTREGETELGAGALAGHAVLRDIAMQSSDGVVIPETRDDARLCANSLVLGAPYLRFYAGTPLRGEDGEIIGALCLLDVLPRPFSHEDVAPLLADLASLVTDEMVLRRKEWHYRSLVETSSDIVTTFDAEGVVLYQSPSLTHCLGYATGELIGRPVFDLVHPDDVEMVTARFAKMLEDRRDVAHHLFRFRHKNGRWHTLECYGRYLLDDPQIGGIVATSRDVTDRVQIEQQFHVVQSSFEQSSIGMALVELDGKLARVNQMFCDITGVERANLSRLYYRDLLHPDDVEASAHNAQMLISGEQKSLVIERKLRHQAGHYFWAQFTVSVVRDANGNPLNLMAQIQDINERKIQNDRLRLLESIAVNANDAILITQAEPVEEPGPRIIYANKAYLDMSGYTLEEVMGKTPRIMQGPDTDPASRESIRTALKRWKPVLVELLNYHKDGTPFWVELSIVPVADESGWFTHWVSVQRDVTARKETEEKLKRTGEEAERAREEAENANRAKSEFLSRMSHELRTPLNAILGFGQLLELEEQNANNRESTEQILKAGRHLLELINEVLDVSRIETGRMALSLEAVGIGEIGRETLDLVRPMAAQHNVHLSATAVFDSALSMVGDRRRIKQVLINLLSNAIKYNHAGGHVTLWAETRASTPAEEGFENGWLRLCVTDTGKGISPEKRERLWVPFDRLDAESSGIEGTGIGLALSRRLAQAMGGDLDIESEGGAGSTFWFELPLAAPLASEFLLSGDIVPASAQPATTKWVALYIEDNQPNVQLMQGILARRPEVRLLTGVSGRVGVGTDAPTLPRHYSARPAFARYERRRSVAAFARKPADAPHSGRDGERRCHATADRAVAGIGRQRVFVQAVRRQ